MQIEREFLTSNILDFLSVLDKCLSETTYAQDRPIYASDMATAASWLVRLHQNQSPADVANIIIDSSTTKYFTDYWRQGDWGKLQAKALKELQDSIKSAE